MRARPRASEKNGCVLLAPSTEFPLYRLEIPRKLERPAVPSVVTPGVRNTKVSQRRPLMGKFETRFSGTALACSGFVVSIHGGWSVAVTTCFVVSRLI